LAIVKYKLLNQYIYCYFMTGTYGAYGGVESGWKQGYSGGEVV